MQDLRIGSRIRAIRLSKNLTLEFIAQRLEMSETGYGDIERGKSIHLTITRLQKIADVLEVKVSDLFQPDGTKDSSRLENTNNGNDLFLQLERIHQQLNCINQFIINKSAIH
jgi:transcriptional regulator with XRE-family HTH domain